MLSIILSHWLDVVCVASGLAWVWLLAKRTAKGLPLLVPRDRRTAFWTLAEFFVCFGLYIVCIGASQQVVRRWLPAATIEQMDAGTYTPAQQSPEELFMAISVGSVASVLAMASVMVWMNLVTPRALREYGLLPGLDDLKLGAKAAFFILPPVLVISTLIEMFEPYEHPVLDLIFKQPSAAMLSGLAVMTIVVAPIFEEFLFRVLFQGGAEQVARRLKLMRNDETPDAKDKSHTISGDEVATWTWWPVLAPALMFAAMHIGQGFAHVPLFFFAMGLGYLYRQTGRMGPGLVVHMILNGLTIGATLLRPQ